jgi:hypothetical protein
VKVGRNGGEIDFAENPQNGLDVWGFEFQQGRGWGLGVKVVEIRDGGGKSGVFGLEIR